MEQLLAILSALGDPTRLRIMLLIRDVELAMGELADVLDQSQPRVSRHVRILAEAGLVRRSKEGAWVFVSVDDRAPRAEVYALIDRMLRTGQPGTTDPIAVERVRLAQVRSGRQRALDDWFAANAGEWHLMATLEGKAAHVEEAMVAAASAGGVGRLLDIGTGTGRLVELLAAAATSATALDRSPEMLRLARSKIGAIEGLHAEMKQGDMLALPFAAKSFDTVILHQVLHFVEEPVAAITEAARVLAPGGKLIIADYAAHAQEELRDRFRHRRLGFEPEDMLRWLSAAGLTSTILSRHPGPQLETILWEGRR